MRRKARFPLGLSEHNTERMWMGLEMAGVTGLEPATSGVTGRRSKPTELHPQYFQTVAACLLPPPLECQAVAKEPHLPASPKGPLVGDDGFEPPTFSV